MARGRKCLRFAGRLASQHIGAGAHTAADQHGLPEGAKRLRKAWMAGTKRTGRALAVDEEFAAPGVDLVGLELAGMISWNTRSMLYESENPHF